MYHHSAGDYQTAASAAARSGRDKMEAIIAKGRASAQSVIEGIMSRKIIDKVVPAPKLKLVYDQDGDRYVKIGEYDGADAPGGLLTVHDHAYQQLLTNVGFPKNYGDHLAKEAGGHLWGKRLAADNVNAILSNRVKQRNLIRAEPFDDPTGATTSLMKGFVSDKFRRLDSRPIADAFCAACADLGLIPIEGVASDTKMRIRAVMPYVFEPIDNEVMIFGTELGNSDYGDGGLVLNLWTMRVWCTNLAVTEKCLRQVHVGGRLPDNVRFSDQTYRKDAEATALAVRDVAADAIAPDRVHRILDCVRNASEEEIRGRDGIDKLLRGMDKSEVTAIKGIYDSPDVVNLPEGETVYRLSNAVTWFAQTKGVTPDRKMWLQEFAGEMVTGDTRPESVKEV